MEIEKMETTTDILFCTLLQNLHMLGLFMSLRDGIRCGDAISIETIYTDFLPFLNVMESQAF